MEEPIIILSDEEDENRSVRTTSIKTNRNPTISKESEVVGQVVFPVKSKKKTSKNPTKQERQVFTWFLCHKFESHQQAAEYILGEKVWSRWYNSSTESGAKQYYRCNRVKYSAKQCSARIYTRFSPSTPEVYLFSNNLDHDHQKSEDPSPHHRTARTPAHVKAGLPHQKEVICSVKRMRLEGKLDQERQWEEEGKMYQERQWEEGKLDQDDEEGSFEEGRECLEEENIQEEDDDEFDEDCGDEDDEDSFFIDTSLLRVEIDEQPHEFINTFTESRKTGEENRLDQTFNERLDQTFNGSLDHFNESKSITSSDDEDEEDDDIVFVDEQQCREDSPSSPSMKIAKIESHFNINQFILDIPKQKFTRMNWHQVLTFASGDEARNYIVQEKIWSKWYFSHTETGAKQYYRCNKAKYSGRQCAARIYLLYESNSDEVHLMMNGKEHDHDSTEFKATYTSLTHFSESLKGIIQKCCELKQKPKDIITKLEALNLPLPSRYHLRKYIVELQEKM